MIWSTLTVFWINPAENTDSPKLMEIVSLTPKSMLVIIFMHLFKLRWWFMMDDNYHQQTPPSLTFARPWAMRNSVIDQELYQYSLLKSTHVFKQKFSFELE